MTPDVARSLSKPYLSGFNPNVIPYQKKVTELLRRDFDYSRGTPEILLSGSYGSAKSILMAHLAVTHCLFQPGSRVCIARKSMPDLKDTIFKEIIEHIEGFDEDNEDAPPLIEGEDYWINTTRASIKFSNGSEIISRSWSDKKYKKGRSLKLSMLIIEELTENDDDDMEAFKTLKARLRRIPGIKENILIAATNPDSPAHWAYKYWMINTSPLKFVFYSVTTDNPFLDPIYIQQLQSDLPPREADRYLRGIWVELNSERVYYEYNSETQYIKKSYDIDPTLPIAISWDFNIAKGKPLSCSVGQYQSKDDSFHIFDEGIIEGLRTLQMLEELSQRGLFERINKFEVFGDATGKAQSTQSLMSNYEQIENFLANYRRKDGSSLQYEMRVPQVNPPVSSRHIKVNAYCKNDLGLIRLFVYGGDLRGERNEWRCAKTDEGLRLTSLKKGAGYIEDDSKDYQHVTTSIGYWIVKESQDAEYYKTIKGRY